MSARTIANDLHRGGGAKMSLKQILGIIQALQKKTPNVEDDFLVRYLAYSPLVDFHTGEVAEQPGADIEADEFDDHFNPRLPVRRIHIPTARNFDTLANSGLEYSDFDESPGRKFGGGATSLDFSTSEDVPISSGFTLGFWIYLPAATNADPIIEIGNIELAHSTAGQLRMYYDGSSSHTKAIPLTRQAWQYISILQTGSTLRLFASGGTGTPVIRSSDSAPSADSDAPLKLKTYTGCYIAHLSLFVGLPGTTDTIKSDWVADAAKGLMDYRLGTLDEITTYPFADSRRPEPAARAGLFYARNP